MVSNPAKPQTHSPMKHLIHVIFWVIAFLTISACLAVLLIATSGCSTRYVPVRRAEAAPVVSIDDLHARNSEIAALNYKARQQSAQALADVRRAQILNDSRP